MIIDQKGFFDLTYCSNIHRGETWDEVFTALKTHVPQLKSHLAPDKKFGIGLRLSNQAAVDLLHHYELDHFKSWLNEHQLYVMTINGFPYGQFHDQRVKEQVYAPDWTQVTRRDYSFRLLKVLEELTPPGGESGFSTSPLSYKPWLNAKSTKEVYNQSSLYLSEIVKSMALQYQDSGKLIHIDIEPEPDCLIETVDEAIDFFSNWLIPIGGKNLAKLMNISLTEAEEHIRRHVQICYDICHSSVEYEDAAVVFEKLKKAGILIGKVQVSAALKCNLEKDPKRRDAALQSLSQFIDPVYLHQIIQKNADGKLAHYADLNHAYLTNRLKDKDQAMQELRTHFHVPIFLEQYHELESTQSDIIKVFKLLQENKAASHLEIETYTWEVLPKALQLDINASIEREYKWIMQQF
ncbi:MAG: metabolite traffic protein EboE [Gammaproteobacteria bacterium]|nr:metabolite traffic protein EboE [Gammaproteobacteria bacterium]